MRRHSGWCRSVYLVVVSLVLSVAKPMERRERKSGDSEVEIEGGRIRKLWESIFTSPDGQVWSTLDDSTADLPLFGIQHKRNRRNLISQLWIPFEQDDQSIYAIGLSGKQGRKKVVTRREKSASTTPLRSRPPRSSESSSSSKSSNLSGKGRPSPTPPPIPPQSRPSSIRPVCTVELNIDFLQLSAIPPGLTVDPSDPNDQIVGTRYVYNDGLRDQDTLDELIGSRASGTCTRIQARLGNEDIGLQLGRGHCQFTYTLRDSKNRKLVFTASGDVVDSLGGTLSITGGSRSALGAFGEVELLPVNLVANGRFEIESGDFFLDPLFYAADARIYIPCDL